MAKAEATTLAPSSDPHRDRVEVVMIGNVFQSWRERARRWQGARSTHQSTIGRSGCSKTDRFIDAMRSKIMHMIDDINERQRVPHDS